MRTTRDAPLCAKRLPVHGRAQVTRREMPADHRHRLAEPTVGDRHTRRSRHRKRRGDPWDDGAGHAGLGAGNSLLTTSAEQVRVTALEADDPVAGTCFPDEQ